MDKYSELAEKLVKAENALHDEGYTALSKDVGQAITAIKELQEALEPSREFAKQWQKITEKRNKKIWALHQRIRELTAQPEQGDTEKLLILADACSYGLYGGERGWEEVNFDKFVEAVKKIMASKALGGSNE